MKEKAGAYLAANSKSVAAFVAATVITVALKFGFDADSALVNALATIVVVTAGVWLAPKNKPSSGV